jgi:hypothetical protein
MSEDMAMIAPAPAHAIDGGDDRLWTPHRLHQVMIMRVNEQARHLHLDQRTDDLVHVAARAEIAAGPGDHDRLDGVGVDQVAERVAQLGVGFEGQRVLSFRPVQRDSGDAVGEFPQEVRRREGRWVHRSALLRRVHARDGGGGCCSDGAA